MKTLKLALALLIAATALPAVAASKSSKAKAPAPRPSSIVNVNTVRAASTSSKAKMPGTKSSGFVKVKTVKAASKSSKSKAPAPKPSGVVNVNTATAQQLAFLPRTGLKAAQRIASYRTAHGSFQRVEDLMEVKGVGEKQFNLLRPYVTVSGDTTLSGKIKSTGSRSRHNACPARKA